MRSSGCWLRRLGPCLEEKFAAPPESTFYGRVKGDSMIEAGIFDGDIAVIDRFLEPHDGSIIVAYVNNEFTIKRLDLSHKDDGFIELQPANSLFPPICIDSSGHFEVWGVVALTKTLAKIASHFAKRLMETMKRQLKSPNYTTHWSDIIELK